MELDDDIEFPQWEYFMFFFFFREFQPMASAPEDALYY